MMYFIKVEELFGEGSIKECHECNIIKECHGYNQ